MKTNYYLDDSLELILTFLCPPIGLIAALVNLGIDQVNWRRHVFCIAWGMAAFAYCYQPTQGTAPDLVRYFAYCEKLGRLPLAQIWGNGIHGEDSLYAFELLCWLIGKIGDKHLLPGISDFCVYYIGMYVTCRIGEKDQYDGKNVARYVYFILLAISF